MSKTNILVGTLLFIIIAIFSVAAMYLMKMIPEEVIAFSYLFIFVICMALSMLVETLYRFCHWAVRLAQNNWPKDFFQFGDTALVVKSICKRIYWNIRFQLLSRYKAAMFLFRTVAVSVGLYQSKSNLFDRYKQIHANMKSD